MCLQRKIAIKNVHTFSAAIRGTVPETLRGTRTAATMCAYHIVPMIVAKVKEPFYGKSSIGHCLNWTLKRDWLRAFCNVTLMIYWPWSEIKKSRVLMFWLYSLPLYYLIFLCFIM